MRSSTAHSPAAGPGFPQGFLSKRYHRSRAPTASLRVACNDFNCHGALLDMTVGALSASVFWSLGPFVLSLLEMRSAEVEDQCVERLAKISCNLEGEREVSEHQNIR